MAKRKTWPVYVWYTLSCGCRFAHGAHVTTPTEVKCPNHRVTCKVKEGT
jgi:hypothetical protein